MKGKSGHSQMEKNRICLQERGQSQFYKQGNNKRGNLGARGLYHLFLYPGKPMTTEEVMQCDFQS